MRSGKLFLNLSMVGKVEEIDFKKAGRCNFWGHAYLQVGFEPPNWLRFDFFFFFQKHSSLWDQWCSWSPSLSSSCPYICASTETAELGRKGGRAPRCARYRGRRLRLLTTALLERHCYRDLWREQRMLLEDPGSERLPLWPAIPATADSDTSLGHFRMSWTVRTG